MSPRVSFTDDRLRPFEMPGGSPVEMARLHTANDGALFVAVRFPPGFHRPGPGAYPAAEEFAVVEGSLTMSRRTYHRGDFVFVPEDYMRTDTETDTGALVVACFHGPPAWTPVTEPTSHQEEVVRMKWTDTQPTDGPLGPGRHLLASPSSDVWMLEDANGVTPTRPAVAVSLSDRVLDDLDPGDHPTELTPPILVWLTR